MRPRAEDHPTSLFVEEHPVVGVGHLVVRVDLHQWNDPLANRLPAVHFTENVLDVRAVLREQIGEGVVVRRRRALVAFFRHDRPTFVRSST